MVLKVTDLSVRSIFSQLTIASAASKPLLRHCGFIYAIYLVRVIGAVNCRVLRHISIRLEVEAA